MDSGLSRRSRPLRAWHGHAWAVAGACACTVAGLAMEPHFDPVNIAMVYLLPVVVVSMRYGRAAAIVSALLCVLAFDFFFVPPKWAFAVNEAQYLLTFAILLAVALVISTLAASIREQARVQAALEAEAQTERIRSALLASISHDLRTPLAVMTGVSSSLASGEGIDPQERRALALSLYEQSRSMSEQVAKVLEMTRLDAGAIEPDRDWNAIPEVAGATLARLRQRLASHRVVTDFPADLPLVRIDATLIDHVFANLLENAVSYTPADTLVRLRAEARDGELLVSVEDFGAGLAPEEFEKVFAKFHRGRAEGGGHGAGLGLSICRAVVALHEGRIWAEQLPGGGTAFRFALPLEAVPEVPAESAQGA